MRRRWWRNDIVERTHACRERRALRCILICGASTSCCLRVRSVEFEGICPRGGEHTALIYCYGLYLVVSAKPKGKINLLSSLETIRQSSKPRFIIRHVILSGVNTGRVPGGASPTSRQPRACRCRARPPRWRVHPAPCASARRQAPSSPRRKNAPRHRSCRSAPACWKRRNRRLQPGLSAAPQPATGP